MLLALLWMLLAACVATINFDPVSPLPTPPAISIPSGVLAYQIGLGHDGINITCHNQDVAVMENYGRRILVVCTGPTFTPQATATLAPTATLTPTATPTRTPIVELPTVTPTPSPTVTQEITMATYSSQPDATAGIDGIASEAAPTSSGATSQSVNTNNASGFRNFFYLKFDLSSIPAGSTVTSATLSFWNSGTNAQNRTLNVFAVLAANSGWVEGLTWNYANPSTVRWAGDAASDGGSDAGGSVSGTDYNGTAMGSVTYIANSPVDTQLDITLNNSMVQAWVDGANYGAVVIRNDTVNSNLGLRTSDYPTDGTKRPKLVIEYTEPGGGQAARTIEIGGQFGIVQYPTGGAGFININ